MLRFLRPLLCHLVLGALGEDGTAGEQTVAAAVQEWDQWVPRFLLKGRHLWESFACEIWEFPIIRGTLLWSPYNKGPTI